jgi:PKD repeat protein
MAGKNALLLVTGLFTKPKKRRFPLTFAAKTCLMVLDEFLETNHQLFPADGRGFVRRLRVCHPRFSPKPDRCSPEFKRAHSTFSRQRIGGDMKLHQSWKIAAAAWAIMVCACGAWGATLRIVSYNIDCSDQDSDHNITGPQHSLPTVIQGIGLHHLGTNAQRADILNVEELNSTTLSNFTVALTNIYGYGTYTYDPTVDTNTGGGPDGLIYNTQTIQVISGRCLRTGETVLLESNGAYVSAHSPGGGNNGVTRGPLSYHLRPIGFGTNADFYMYISHARSTSDDSQGDARYAEAQELRSDAKYNLPAGVHILYAGDWNLFNGSDENAYKCLTGQVTSDGINWADTNLSVWANTNQTQGYDPTSKTYPPTTTGWSNLTTDNALYLYDDSTDAGEFATTSRLDVQLPNVLMYGVYNGQGGVQIAPNTSDPYDVSNFPASQYHYAFEVFGNNGSVPYGDPITAAGNTSLNDLNNTTPNATTLINDIVEITGTNFTGSDHYPIFGDYQILVYQPAVADFTATPTNGAAPLTVAFADTSTGTVTNWFWTFGDGSTNTATTTNVTYTFTNAGAYTVTETVTGPLGGNSAAQTIVVLTPFQAWQLQYFGCTSCPQAQPTADADGTGQNNLFKYIAGLNPTNPASVFVFNIATVPNKPAEKNLIFSPSVAGRTYTPLFSTSLLNGSWAPLTTAATPPVTNGSQVTITDTNAILPHGYYEMEISGP